MNQKQIQKAKSDYQTVVNAITGANQTYDFEEFKYEYDRVDFRFWDKDNNNLTYAEIKGRDIPSTKFGDFFVSKNKVDYVNERVELERKFSNSPETINGVIFSVFTDGKIYYMDSQFLAENATVSLETMRKSKYGYGDDVMKTELVYKYNLFSDENKSVCNTGVYVLNYPVGEYTTTATAK